MLAEAVLGEPWGNGPRPLRALEVGCGLGLAGCAGLARGLNVTFSDVDITALAFAERNARLNGFAGGFRTLPLDMRSPPDGERFDVVLGADLMYEERLVDPLIALIDAVLEPGGLCLIADPDRRPAQAFQLRLPQPRYTATATTADLDGRPSGTIYRIRRSG
jgi:predicted nicotinamide N-methyase